jgi:hypothetical protein
MFICGRVTFTSCSRQAPNERTFAEGHRIRRQLPLRAYVQGEFRLHDRVAASGERQSDAASRAVVRFPLSGASWERLARGGQTIVRAGRRGRYENLFVDSAASGFSANACGQFAQLIEDTSPGGMSIGFCLQL